MNTPEMNQNDEKSVSLPELTQPTQPSSAPETSAPTLSLEELEAIASLSAPASTPTLEPTPPPPLATPQKQTKPPELKIAKSAPPPPSYQQEANFAYQSAQQARQPESIEPKQSINADLYNYASELAKLDEQERIEVMTKDEIEAVALFDKYFKDNFEKLVREREKQEINALGEPLEDYLDRTGKTRQEFVQEVANKVYNEDRIRLKAQHEINVRKTIRLAEIQARKISEQMAQKQSEERAKRETIEKMRQDYEQYIRGELFQEVLSKGVPINAYKKAYEEIKNSINILSPKAKELTRLAVLNFIRENPNPRPDKLEQVDKKNIESKQDPFFDNRKPLWL